MVTWLTALKQSIPAWLQTLYDRPGFIRFSREGNIIEPTERTGLGASALALKVAYQIDWWPQLDQATRTGWCGHLRGFQRRRTGFFEGQAVLRTADRNAGLFKKNIGVRLAETRQAVSALLGVGERPEHPVSKVPAPGAALQRTLESYNWHKLPWHAGSQTSHHVYFHRLNGNEEAVQQILSFLDDLQDPNTGSWHRGDPSPTQKVNAAMKILTAYALLEHPFRYPEKLIDLALSHTDHSRHACNSIDTLYVMHQASAYTDHRSDAIALHAEQFLESVKAHRKPDGAFSYYPDRANDRYYGADVSQGLVESDIHGTHLLVWAVTLSARVLGFADELGWRIPVT
ncbi:MAG: hypothetical protein GYB64_01130 [Chloroflexi bacterium]|nr:hypothetical protein [Chloroflexota bacterium]